MCLEMEFHPIRLGNDKDVEYPTKHSHKQLDVLPTVVTLVQKKSFRIFGHNKSVLLKVVFTFSPAPAPRTL